MATKPFFSIIIPTLNEQEFLPHLLTDLTSQTNQDFEVTIVDAKSKDNTIKRAAEFNPKLPSLKIISSSKRNVSHQRNLGAKHARANWLIFMDADNRLPSYFLQGIKYKLELKQPQIFTCWIKPDTNFRKDQTFVTLYNLLIEFQKNTKKPYGLEAMMGFNKKVFFKLNGFNPELLWSEGSELLSRAAKQGFYYEIFKNPQYQYSLRRLRKQGTLKSIRNVAKIELSRIINKPIPKHQVAEIYPMKGGGYFTIEKPSHSLLNKVQEKIKSILS
jgi:glycosyltransferase involved in cell wall biosynthesis